MSEQIPRMKGSTLMYLVAMMILVLVVIIMLSYTGLVKFQPLKLNDEPLETRIARLENKTLVHDYYISGLFNSTVATQNFHKEVVTWHDSVEKRIQILNQTRGNK